MKVKHYLGDTMQDAIFKVKADLGPNAVILHTRKIRQGGFFGLFGKKMVEVVATLEDDRESQLTKELRQELNLLREKVQKMDQEKQETRNVNMNLYQPIPPIAQLLFPGRLQPHADKLVKEGVFAEGVTEICQAVIGLLEVHQLHKEEDVYPAVLEQMIRRIPIMPPIEIGGKRKVMAFVGPTGVGKTTTIAKLAARIALEQRNKRVGLITADTYRIAAVEQLKTYSDIIRVPLRVIYNGSDLERALQDLSYCDLIFIDTAGRSQRNDSQMEQLRDILPKNLIDEIHLVLSMNTSYEDMMEIIDRFGELYLSSLIFTKQDEAKRKGVILNVLKQTGYKISYITFGQDVPEDIEEADPRKIAEMILKE